MKFNIFFSLLALLIAMQSCYMYKEDRKLKKTTKDWRNAPVLFSAYADSPISSTFLKLRANKKFEFISTGMFQTFSAGSWTSNQDTITLFYVDQNQKITNEEKAYINRKKSRLIFAKDTIIYMQLRIMTNEL